MTAPRIVLPGDVVFTSARTVQRHFLLRPDKELTSAVKYLLAHYSTSYGIELYAACMMSSHLHLVYRDTRGEGPNFLRDLHRGIAIVVQRLRGWSGGVFAERPCLVRILSDEALIDKFAYTLANPVERSGVADARSWPGLWSGITQPQALLTHRPRVGFSSRGRLPDTAELKFTVPQQLVASLGQARALQQLRAAFEKHARLNRANVLKGGGKFLTPSECMRVSPRAQSTALEPRGMTKPEFAILGGGGEAYERAVRELRAFRRAYRAALLNFRKGIRETLFPAGTFQLRSVLALACGTA